jgi:hypothetical protein
MDPRPDVIRTQIETTRASLDRHLDELGTQIHLTRDRVASNAQYWGGIGAVAAGVMGAVVFWPRRPPGRRVLKSFRAAEM